MYQLNTKLATKQVLDLLNPIAKALPSYPETKATFPMIIVNQPIQKPKQLKEKIDLQWSIEVWGDSTFKVADLFDEVILKLETLNIRLSSDTINFKDPVVKKWRKGGNFEVRYNMRTNSYEINR